MNKIKNKIILTATLASAFFLTGCSNVSTGNGVEIIDKSIYHGQSSSINHDKLDDISAWIDSIPEIDRVPELSQALNKKGITSLQKEILYNRITQITDDQYYVIQWAESRIQEQNYSGALALLNQERFTNTKNPQVLYLQGRSLLALKRYDEADKVLLTATHYNNSNGDYYNALAYVSFARGQDSRAEAALNKSINLNGNQPYALYNMAISKYNDEMYHDALEYFTQSALLYKKDKQDLKVSRVISDIYDMGKFIKKSKITEAIKTIKKG